MSFILRYVGLGILATAVAVGLASFFTSLAEARTVSLSSDNLIVLNGPINDASASEAILEVRRLNDKSTKEPIYLFLATPGGEIEAGLAMVESLKGSQRPVVTITQFAASMGFQLVQQLGDRYILSSGVLMSHHARGAVSGEFGGPGISQLQSRIGMWERRVLRLDKDTVARTKGKQTLASYQSAYDHEMWVSGPEAVDQGYADEVVVVTCDKSLSGKKTKEASLLGGLIHVKYKIANCPLDLSPSEIETSNVKDNTDGLEAIINQFKQDYQNTQTRVIPMEFK